MSNPNFLRAMLPGVLFVAIPLAAHAGQMKPSTAVPSSKAPVPVLPSTPVTALPSAPVSSLPPPPIHPSQTEVAYQDGQLQITATNSSLNEILRQISRKMGMTIKGGVVDEPVYGKYGPGAPTDVLATLLTGTGSNVLFVQNSGVVPSELILTPRQGGVSPPNPNAAGFEGQTEEARRRANLQGEPLMAAPQFAPIPVRSDGSIIGTGVPNSGNGDAPGTAPGASNSPSPIDVTTPNGLKTPQQIYEQLQRLRQQQVPLPRP